MGVSFLKQAALGTIATMLLAGCSSDVLGTTSSGKPHSASTTVCPQSVSNRGPLARMALTCTAGDGGGSGFVHINDLNYVDGVSDGTSMQIEMTYDGMYDIQASQDTIASNINVTYTNLATGATMSTTFAPQNSTTRHTMAGGSCGFWCGYLAGKLIDGLYNWITNPCSGDCGHMVYGVPTSPPPPGTQWLPRPILIPTGGGYPPGWGPAPPDNGQPASIPPIVACPPGWMAPNCTGNDHNSIR